MDGSGLIETLDVGEIRIRDVAVDTAGGKIYWGERETGLVQRANLDGTNVEPLFTEADGLLRPHGVEIDPAAGMVYWTDTRTYAVNRGNMDGSGPVDVLYDTLPDAWDLELALDPIPEPSAPALVIVGLIGLLAWRWRNQRLTF